jgi:hypothetical protein
MERTTPPPTSAATDQAVDEGPGQLSGVAKEAGDTETVSAGAADASATESTRREAVSGSKRIACGRSILIGSR